MYLLNLPHMPVSLRTIARLSFVDTHSPCWMCPARLRNVRRVFAWLCSVALLGAVLLTSSYTAFGVEDAQAPAGRLPNIVLILADDLGYGDVGCYNPESKVPTPHLDKLAAEGMRFTDAHSAATVCTPSRYSLLTGRMCFRTGMRGVFTGAGGPCLIEEGRLTLPQLLRNKGYATACMGKWHVGLTFFDKEGRPIHQDGLEAVKRIDYTRPIPDGPIHRGFDYFFGTACCPGTDWLYAYIEGDRIPVPPTKPLDRSGLPQHPYSEDNRPGLIAPGYNLEELDLVFLEKSRQWLERHVREHPGQPFFLYHATSAVHLPSFPAAQFQGATKAGPHGDFIFELDYVVGQLMQTLERLGVADNTLVIFTSDNGPEVTTVLHMRADYGHDGARPWRGLKRDNWEGGHRVPLIVRWPGLVKPGSICDLPICQTDIMATCAQIVGAKLPDNAAEDSNSFLHALLGRSTPEDAQRIVLHQTISLDLGIRRGAWKYLDHKGSGGNRYDRGALAALAIEDTAPDAPGQLYNLAEDPVERINLAGQKADLAAELKRLLEHFKATGRSAPFHP